EVNISDEFDRVWADPSALERIFINLLENAVNFSPQGEVVEVTARASLDGRIEVSVKDRGEGIPPEHLPRIFERFYRVDPARSRNRGGTGLGLAIVKHLVQGHSGEVSVESTPGKGATFRLTLPTP
ncbi:sensor histidine kinase, partial [Nitrospinota bacterium]